MFALVAGNFAALRAILPRIPNPGLVIMVLVLDAGILRMASQRGAARACWLGFEVAGWAYVITMEVLGETAWRMDRSLFQVHVLRRSIGLPIEMNRFMLFGGSRQLLISLAIALVVGIFTRWAWKCARESFWA